MQPHNGIRPQDVVILLKYALLKASVPTSALAAGLGISPSEISKSVQRSRYSGLITPSNKVALNSLLEFLRFGLPFVFPIKPGAPVRGVPTALSHPSVKESFVSGETFVWPSAEGTVRGTTVLPLYEALPHFVIHDAPLYFALALVDMLRIGKNREKNYATEKLEKLITS